MLRALGLAAALVLCLAATVVVSGRGAARAPWVGGGARARTTPDAKLLAALDAQAGPVFATLYLTQRAKVPSTLRALEPQLVRLCEGLERATDGRFGYALVHPDADEDARAFATARGVGERRVRRIERDGWSETSVYATLELSVADGRHALIEGLAPDDLDHLQRRMAAHLELLAEPARPRILLSAPAAGYARLERELAQHGDVTRVALDRADAALDEQLATCDLLVWTEPNAMQLAAGAVERIDALLARGASLVVAASARDDLVDPAPDAPGARVVRSTWRDVDLEPLWRALALEPLDTPLFDETCLEVLVATGAAAEQRAARVPFVLRAIAPNQDFRRFDGQPNATLVFASPAALALDEGGLSERGWRAHVLATSSDASFAPAPDQDLEEGVAADALTRANGRPLPKLPLLVELEPQRALEGRAVVAASAHFLHDEFLVGESAQPQRRALDLVVERLTDDARLVAARGAFARAPAFDAPSRASEGLWRVVGLAAVPVLLGLLALVRRRRGGGATSKGAESSNGSRPMGVPRGLVAAAGALAATAFVVGPLTRLALSGSAPVADELTALARDAVAARGDVFVELVLPADHRLPIDVRAAARPMAGRLRSLAAAVDGLDARRTDLAATAADHPARALPLRTLVGREGEVERARRVRMGLVLRAGERIELVELESARAFETLDFRLGHALWRLATGERTRIAFAASTPRLSSAEAHAEFQQLQLFAPSGDDVFSAARERLVRDGFDVVHLDPDRPGAVSGGEAVDAVVWLQPRRSTAPMLNVLSNVLRTGGGALVAGQAHELVARQLEGRDLETVYWPRPTNADLNELWFAEIGAVVDPALVFDELVLVDRADVRSESGARGRVTTTQDRALPFQVRASSSAFAADSPLAGLRDLPWYGGNALELDRARLAELGLEADVIASTSPNAWSYPWDGGYLAPDVLAGTSDAVRRTGARPLVVSIEGVFPPTTPLGRLAGERGPEPASGRLLLVGSSALFANGRLGDERFGTRGALTSLTASVALPERVARLARGRGRADGLGAVGDASRFTWRTWGLAWAPLLALLLGLARLLARRTRGAGGAA